MPECSLYASSHWSNLLGVAAGNGVGLVGLSPAVVEKFLQPRLRATVVHKTLPSLMIAGPRRSIICRFPASILAALCRLNTFALTELWCRYYVVLQKCVIVQSRSAQEKSCGCCGSDS